MSPTTGSARPPASSICAAAVYTVPSSLACGSAVLAISATLAPSRAARSAIARPMPRLPPEMNKVLPSRVIGAFLPSAVPRLGSGLQAAPGRLHLGLGGGAVGPGRALDALARLQLLVAHEEVPDL